MSDPLHPTAGARFVLEKIGEEGEGRAVYRARIFTPTAVHAGTAALDEAGGVELAPTGAPEELERALAMFARLTARGAAKRREDGLPPWPPRVTRWRP